jgi:hypothetical protein
MSKDFYRPVSRLLGEIPVNYYSQALQCVEYFSQAPMEMDIRQAIGASIELSFAKTTEEVDFGRLAAVVSQCCWDRAQLLASTSHTDQVFTSLMPMIDRLVGCALLLDESEQKRSKKDLITEIKRINKATIRHRQEVPKSDKY